MSYTPQSTPTTAIALDAVTPIDVNAGCPDGIGKVTIAIPDTFPGKVYYEISTHGANPAAAEVKAQGFSYAGKPLSFNVDSKTGIWMVCDAGSCNVTRTRLVQGSV